MSWSGGNQALSTLPTQEEVERMLKEAGASYTLKRIPANTILFWEGEPHRNHYYLVDGKVEVYKVDSAFRKKVIDLYGPGAFFGFCILTESSVPMTTARTCVDTSLIVIPEESYFKALHTSPDFADATVRHLFGLLAMQTDEVINSSFYAASQRVALLLLSLARDGGDRQDAPDGSVALPYGNNEIAEMLGISRNSVTASLSRLQVQGVVTKQRNNICITNMEKLEEIARLDGLA